MRVRGSRSGSPGSAARRAAGRAASRPCPSHSTNIPGGPSAARALRALRCSDAPRPRRPARRLSAPASNSWGPVRCSRAARAPPSNLTGRPRARKMPRRGGVPYPLAACARAQRARPGRASPARGRARQPGRRPHQDRAVRGGPAHRVAGPPAGGSGRPLPAHERGRRAPRAGDREACFLPAPAADRVAPLPARRAAPLARRAARVGARAARPGGPAPRELTSPPPAHTRRTNLHSGRAAGRRMRGETEAVVGRGRPGRRRDEAGSSTAVQSLVELLVRALGLERAALLVEKPPQGALVPVVVHGDPPPASLAPGEAPGAGAWSLALPVGAGEGARGLLLLGRPGGAPLTPAERALAAGVADALVQLVESERQAAELRHTRELLGRADRLSALGMLAAGVAHEIRNPLVSVRTFIQLLPERLADEEF